MRWNGIIQTAAGEAAQGLTSHQTHYRSYQGRVLWVKWPNQQCQSTEGRQVQRIRIQSHQVHPAVLTMIQLCSMKQEHTKYIQRQMCEMGPVHPSIALSFGTAELRLLRCCLSLITFCTSKQRWHRDLSLVTYKWETGQHRPHTLQKCWSKIPF